jgi:hypothetical protein
MPKLREYIKDAGHDILFSSSRHIATVPTPGGQYAGGQPVKLKLDATPGQQTRQVRGWKRAQITLHIHQY